MKSIKTIGVGLLAAVALATATPAHAEVQYAELLSGLCLQIEASPSAQTISDLVAGMSTVGWPAQGESAMLHRAVDQVCPQYRGILASWSNMGSHAPVGWYGRVANFPPFNPAWMSYTG